MSAARPDGSRRGGLVPWGGVWRQSRRDAAPLAVGMLVVAVAAFLSAAVPMGLAAVATSAVQAVVAEPAQAVDVVVSVPIDSGYPLSTEAAAVAARIRDQLDAGMPAELRSILADPVTALVGPELKAGVIADRPGRVQFAYVASDAGPAVTWLEGRAPVATGDPSDPPADGTAPQVEVAISDAAARLMGAHAGDRLPVDNPHGTPPEVWVSGVFRAEDPGDDAWAVVPTLLEPRVIDGSAAQASVGLMVTSQSLPFAQVALFPSVMTRTFTYRVVTQRLDAERAPLLATQARALASGRRSFDVAGSEPVVTTRLDRVLDRALARVAAASAQASVLLLGLLATALLVEVLAAGLVIERRSVAISQWRARGATLPAVGLANAAESVVLTAVAGVAGVALAAALTGGVPPLVWVLPPLLAAVVPQPWLAVRAAARAGRVGPAAGARSGSSRLRRVAAEVALVLLAGAALATLVVRGVAASAGSVWSDAVVLAAPVLVAFAAALALVRLHPRLQGLALASAARRHGVVPLLAAARARANGPATAALVVAGAVAALAASAAATVAQGRLDASWDAVGGDAVATATSPAGLPDAVARLDGDAGLTAAAAAVVPGAQLLGSGLDRSVTVVAVDAGSLERLLALTPGPDAPALGHLAGPQADPLPVLGLALPGWDAAATLRWGDERVSVQSVGSAPVLPPQLELDDDPAVIVDRARLAAALGHDVPPRVAWVAGPDAEARLAAAVNGSGASVVSREGWLAAQASAPLPEALGRLFSGSVALAFALGGLAVVLLAASGASERTRAAGRLRVVGAPRRAAARVAWLEAAVPAVAASAVGVAVGIGLSGLLVVALDLKSVTAGRAAPHLITAWWCLALPFVLGLVAWVSVAVAGLPHRREPLGPVMRAG